MEKTVVSGRKAVIGIGNHLPEGFCVGFRVFASIFNVVEYCPWLPKQTSIFGVYDVESAVVLKVLKCHLLIGPFSGYKKLTSKESFFFADFSNFLNIDGRVKDLEVFLLREHRDCCQELSQSHCHNTQVI